MSLTPEDHDLIPSGNWKEVVKDGNPDLSASPDIKVGKREYRVNDEFIIQASRAGLDLEDCYALPQSAETAAKISDLEAEFRKHRVDPSWLSRDVLTARPGELTWAEMFRDAELISNHRSSFYTEKSFARIKSGIAEAWTEVRHLLNLANPVTEPKNAAWLTGLKCAVQDFKRWDNLSPKALPTII